MCGAYIGLCLPRRIVATSEASLPSTTPLASTTYQRRSMCSGFGEEVFINVEMSAHGARPAIQVTRAATSPSKADEPGADRGRRRESPKRRNDLRARQRPGRPEGSVGPATTEAKDVGQPAPGLCVQGVVDPDPLLVSVEHPGLVQLLQMEADRRLRQAERFLEVAATDRVGLRREDMKDPHPR